MAEMSIQRWIRRAERLDGIGCVVTGATVPVDGGYTVRGDPSEAIGDRPASLDPVRDMFRT